MDRINGRRNRQSREILRPKTKRIRHPICKHPAIIFRNERHESEQAIKVHHRHKENRLKRFQRIIDQLKNLRRTSLRNISRNRTTHEPRPARKSRAPSNSKHIQSRPSSTKRSHSILDKRRRKGSKNQKQNPGIPLASKGRIRVRHQLDTRLHPALPKPEMAKRLRRHKPASPAKTILRAYNYLLRPAAG